MTVQRRADETGQAAALLVGALFVGLAVAGIVVDGARLFTARRDLQAVADSAALAGASAIDEPDYRASGGRDVHLDPDAAREAVDAVLRDSGLPPSATAEVRVDAQRVEVRVQRPVPLTLLGIVGLGAQTIGARAAAAPRTG